MERIGIVGMSLNETDVEGLERLARPAPEGFDPFARELADELAASELVVLATCNRIEVIFAREVGHLPTGGDRELVATKLGLAQSDPLRERLHLHTGREAARHLFRVACSLDSVVVGEDQILAQTRDAYSKSEHAGLVGRLLGTLFEHAFQVGKQVRTDTDLSRIPVSVVSLGLSEIATRLPGMVPRVALLGAGEMAELVVKNADEHGLKVALVANRTLARAEKLARLAGAKATTIEAFLAGGEACDALVSATSAPGYVVEREALLALAARAPSGRPFVAIDLAIPRDVEPVQHASLEVIGLDELRASAARNRALRAAAAGQAEAIVEQKLEAFLRRAASSAINETLAEVRSESESVFERELAHLFVGKLAHVGADERKAIEHWARATFGRVTHVPISAIKRLANDRTLFGPSTGSEGMR